MFLVLFFFMFCDGAVACLLDRGWVLPVYAAIVLAEQGGEVFIFGCKGGEVDIFVVVGALCWWFSFRHDCVCGSVRRCWWCANVV